MELTDRDYKHSAPNGALNPNASKRERSKHDTSTDLLQEDSAKFVDAFAFSAQPFAFWLC